ncbi:MAG: P63C domain-containing protein [Desulfobacterales bacterium]|nr:P63C domain-containing protein [Desulfobacterales bacterium]
MAIEKIQKAIYIGDLPIGDSVIKAAVLEDGTRLLTRATFVKAIGRTGKAKGGRAYDDEFKTPVFLTAKNLKPYISNELLENSEPIIFKMKGKESIGYKAELLPQVCGVFIDADEAGTLLPNQEHIVQKCRILLRGFATVGIIALVDEATGYQEVRDRLALQKILDKFITDEWAKWTKTFPDEYYKELFKLHNMPYPPQSTKRPSYIGHWTNDIVYSRLAPGVLKKLKKINPRQPSGSRKRKFHQHLTRDWGIEELREHLSNIIFLMKSCATWADFKRRLNRAKPKYGDTMPLDFPD